MRMLRAMLSNYRQFLPLSSITFYSLTPSFRKKPRGGGNAEEGVAKILRQLLILVARQPVGLTG